jgi:zinc protease
MKRIFFVLLTLFAVTACQQAEPVASDETSPAGIKYSLINISSAEDVALQVAWPSDWSFRAETNPDVPYVAAQLLLAGGAEGYPAGQAGEKFADLKAEANFNAGAEYTFGYLKFKKADEKEVIKIANAHLTRPSLEQTWLDRVKDGIAKNLTEIKARPESQLFDAARWAMLGTHPLRKYYATDSGANTTLVTQDMVKQWLGEVITRKPKALVLSGNLTAQEGGEIVDALFENLAEPKRTVDVAVKANFAPRRILLHNPTIKTSQLFFAAPMPPTSAGYDVEDLLLNDALGGGEASALFQAVRTELRASYSFTSGIDVYTQSLRFLFMTGEVETSKMAETEKVVRQAYHAFHQSGVKSDVSFLKTPYLEHFAGMKSKPEAVSYAALQALLDNQPASRALTFRNELDAITADKLNARLTRSFPKVGDFVLFAISPDANALPGACVISKPEEAVNCP